VVVHAYNPTYLEGRSRKTVSLRSAEAKVSKTISKRKYKKKGKERLGHGSSVTVLAWQM
jgi:hypothetical protein